jgi:pyridoxal phosphate enzyme (YggS family)
MTDTDKQILDVAGNLAAVRDAVAAGQPSRPVEIVAVSKLQSMERIQPALAAGHRSFGENRVQEAEKKWAGVRESHPDLSLHLIGPLQTNKAAAAVNLFDVIQTVDRPKLARALAGHMPASGRRPQCMIQVNIGDEPQKAGASVSELPDLLAACRGDIGLPIVGLMCIPPVDQPPAPYFALLAKLAARHDLDRLSMGMSGDFEIAVEFGATSVRVGTAIFGPRPAPG